MLGFLRQMHKLQVVAGRDLFYQNLLLGIYNQ